MDIGAWLRGIGLGQYEAAFRDHEVEADGLPDLTDADLEKLGLPLGPRTQRRSERQARQARGPCCSCRRTPPGSGAAHRVPAIPSDGRYPPLDLSPAQQRRLTLSALLDQMEGLAQRKLVLMLLEDAHWADAASLELLNLAIERLRRLPILLLVTYRPEFDAPWQGLPEVTSLPLGKLERHQAEAMIECVRSQASR